MKKEAVLKKAIKWAKKQGFSGIKANYEAYPTPTQYSSIENEDVFTPDITANKSGRKNYIEVTLKGTNRKRLVSKLKLLNKLSTIKGGKLILLAPHGHKAFAERIINRHNLNSAKLVYLR